MTTPKTNWTTDDYYNLSDHNRILENLNLFAVFVPSGPIEIVPYNIGDFIPFIEKRKICDFYNALVRAVAYEKFPEIPLYPTPNTIHRWFNARELNFIEGIIIYIFETQSKIAKYGTGNYYGTKIYGGGFFG